MLVGTPPERRAPEVTDPARGGWPLRGAGRLGLRLPWAICLITAVAAVLRLVALGGVSSDDFYDAAVRSMTLSLHNFLFGAFDPRGILSIDKPPLDLWLQVLSVKLLGWSGTALKLPEALSGTLAVPLVYDAVRRVLGRPAGLACAATLAVLPASVLTARSDTMDSVMMLLVVAALWLTLRACATGQRRALLLAGAALGLAFNVKLLQAFVPVPALAALYLLAGRGAAGARGSLLRRAGDLLAAGGVMAAVSLSWAVVVTLAPGRHPWAVGSSDGSVWNAMFVFNGLGKLAGASASHKPGGPGLFRLLVSTGWHYDLLFGCILVAALAVAGAGAAVTLSRRRPPATAAPEGARDEPAAAANPRLPRALLTALGVWTLVSLVVFDTMSTVHARYLEAFSPALAALVGFGATSLAGFDPLRSSGRRRPSLAAIAVALGLTCAYTLTLRAPVGWGASALILSTLGAALLVRAGGYLGAAARWLTAGLIVATALVFPVHETLSLVRQRANDSLGLATAPPADTAALAAYLPSHTVGLRYELAADEPLSLAPLIIRDQRPILPLTSFGGRVLTSVAVLRAAVRAGQVRYGLVGAYRCGPAQAHWAACAPAARWVRAHGVDVTAAAGLTGHARLYRLDAQSAATS